MIARLLGLVAVVMLGACGAGDNAWAPPPQSWQDLTIRIETRPVQLRQGMNEFLVIANRQQRGFTSDLMVDVRTDASEWRQAMPDGALGVYRRALPVRDLQHDRLYVRLQRHGERGLLVFPLAGGNSVEKASR